MQEALLTQKLEFLELELAESRQKEAQLRQMNQSLLTAFGSPNETTLHEQLDSELHTAKVHYDTELTRLKTETTQTIHTLTCQIEALTNENTQLQLKFKQEKAALETKLQESQAKVQTLETELQTQLTGNQNTASNTLREVRSCFQKENQALRQQILQLQAKLKPSSGKATPRQVSPLNRLYQFDKDFGNLKEPSKVLALNTLVIKKEREIANLQQELNQWREWAERKTELSCGIPTARIEVNLKNELENARFEREEMSLRLEKAYVQVKQYKLVAKMAEQKRLHTEEALKSEIRGLLNGSRTSREETVLTSTRNRGAPRSMTPLNISAISSTESSLINIDDIAFKF